MIFGFESRIQVLFDDSFESHWMPNQKKKFQLKNLLQIYPCPRNPTAESSLRLMALNISLYRLPSNYFKGLSLQCSTTLVLTVNEQQPKKVALFVLISHEADWPKWNEQISICYKVFFVDQNDHW